MEIARLEAVKRANDTDRTYDESGHTDQFTLNMLRYSGIRCRILGTFRACESGSDDEWVIHYGSDISNFNAGQGMTIYKPSGPSLERVVNRRRIEKDSSSERKVGQLRYSAAIMEADAPEAVPVSIQASDLIAQRTALFGMTRTGKSNTTKTIAKALFELRSEDRGVRVGQLIFDPNGEYANDNPQDQGCLRNLQYEKAEYEGHVQTYGSHEHPHDPERNITKFNFYGAQEPQSPPASERDLEQLLHSLYQGKQIIDDALAEETAGYVTDFRNARLDDIRGAVGERARGEYTRFRRRLFVYRCMLASAGFKPPEQLPTTNGLFSREIGKQMSESLEMGQYVSLLDGTGGQMRWDVAGNFVRAFAQWTKTPEFEGFDRVNAVWCVRADARQRTREVVVRVLNRLLPDHQLRECPAPYKMATQTALYGDKTQKPGEVDLYLHAAAPRMTVPAAADRCRDAPTDRDTPRAHSPLRPPPPGHPRLCLGAEPPLPLRRVDARLRVRCPDRHVVDAGSHEHQVLNDVFTLPGRGYVP